MTTDSLDAARRLRKILDENIRGAGDAPVPPASVKALSEENLWGIMTPQEVGGGELPISEVLDIFEEVARADGSTGWCLMAGASAVAYFGAYCPSSFTDKFFANGIPLVAGQFAPNGMGRRVEGGYQLTGQYSFGSGIDYANWVGAGFLVPPPEGSDAPHEYRFTAVPKSEVELLGNWDVMGLRQTASLDYKVEDVFVPEESTFLFATPTRRRGGPIFEMGVMALTAAGHAGFALGVARRALDELKATSKTKIRMGSGNYLQDGEDFLRRLGQLESRFRAARAWVYETFEAMESRATEIEVVDPEFVTLVRQSTVHVTEEAAEIVREVYLLAGTTSLREGPIQRCFRDIHAASQHFFASPASTLDYARGLIDASADEALDAN